MFMDGSYIHYTYDAAGTLLRKGYYVGEELELLDEEPIEIPDIEYTEEESINPMAQLMSNDEPIEEDLEQIEVEEEILYTDVIDYCGNCIYENGTLRRILVEGGYITFDSSQPVYHFYLKDHLGNNRVVANVSGEVEQVNHYYPYGGLMAESTGGDVQRYKYNGKELDRMLGLDWYDYGARHYDGALTVWGTMDPLCEKYYNISPYVYCGNNPINAFDPDGRDIIPILFNSTDNSGAAVGFRCYSNAKVIAAMKEFGKTDYGNMFVASFIPEGKSQYGVKGSGKYSDHVFRIEQYNLKDPTDQHIHMGNRNGSFDVKIIDGRLNIVLSLDVINQNINELIETISHELTGHGYLLDKIVASYNEGGINAVDELLSKTSVKSEHHDIVTQKEHKGGKLYHTVRKQLTQNNTKLNDIINERMEFYEKNY